MIEKMRKTKNRKAGTGKAQGEPRGQIENSVEYRLGCQLLDGLTSQFHISSEEAAAMLEDGAAPQPLQVLSTRVTQTLNTMKKEGRLTMEPEQYLEDPDFLQLIGHLPAEAAVRVYEAERGMKSAGEREAKARTDGEQNAMEKLRARQALPRPMRSSMPASAQPDFEKMSSQEFDDFKKRYFGY